MKILRTMMLIGLVVSWEQAECKIKSPQEEAENTFVEQQKRAHRLGKAAGQFYKSKQQKPETTGAVTQIPQKPTLEFNMNDLFEAAKHGNAAVVKYNLLLNPEANIAMPLTFAAMHGYINVLDALITTVQITTEQYLDALCTAAQYGQLGIVKKVLQNFKRESGVKKFVKGLFTEPKLPSTQPVTPLMEACRYAHPHVVSVLLQSIEKDTINNRDSTGMTALIWACKTIYTMPDPMTTAEIVSELINAEANVNIQDDTGWTALMYAVGRNCFGAVQALLNVDDIKIDAKSKEGSTALKIAEALTLFLKGEFARNENAKIIKLLTDATSK
jgi:ankyrin repeat protein